MSIYNEDELVAPSWINQEYFANVLQKYENNENIIIKKLEISPASKKGDHYASIMFRCKVTYNNDNSLEFKQKSLILKTLPDEGMKADLLQESKVFETEISMYTETLPKIEKILAECGEPTKLAAEIIYHTLQPRKVLIFEDLCELGYDTLRSRSTTEDELQMIYRKVAKLHAVSFMLGQTEDHACVTKYDEGIFSSSAIMKMDYMSQGIFHFIDMLSKHEDLKVYEEKVKALQPEITEKCKALYNAYKLNKTQKDIFVLNHGDFHMKNLMFKFNAEQQAEDLIMVDYQICCYAPLSIDLIYSQYMMMRPEFRLRRNEFMQYYFSEFIRVLKKINFKGELPRYSDLQIANLHYRHFSLFLLSTFLPLNHVVLSASEEELKEMNISDYIENGEKTASTYQHPGYIKELHELLPSLLIEGYLD
ncbi:uncharacterized protein LOC135948847 [Calliphora vicina]|uniref:uncharacterized protein LOC135948847 n=1 Tax=Calliphora vicina TaxID=7373 RepID=UPI00325AAA66